MQWKKEGQVCEKQGYASLLIAGNTVIYMMIISGTYYIPLMDELQINNTQLGMMGVAFGVTAALCYFPGGWLADRVSARKLLAISYILTGLGGFYFASFPSYLMCVLLHAYWGVTTSLIFWAASIKATRQLAAVMTGRATVFWKPDMVWYRDFTIFRPGFVCPVGEQQRCLVTSHNCLCDFVFVVRRDHLAFF